MITLPYRSLPGYSRLFVDYCENNPKAVRYFMGHYSDLMAYETHLRLLEERSYKREQLAAALREQNQRFGSGKEAFANIDLLESPDTFAVVTGQQVGLLTGPMYTVYKALTAVHTVRWLADLFPAYKFVPVFWLESEDHDLAEAGETWVLDGNAKVQSLRYPQELNPEEKNYRPVGSIAFDNELETALETLRQSIANTEFTDNLLKQIRTFYTPGTTFADSFARFLNSLYPDLGLILFDPSAKEIKPLLSPVILQELETFPITGEEVIKRSAELEQGYHAQAKPKAVNLFFHNNGNRYPIEPIENGFFLKGSRRRFSGDELLEIANTEPWNFSPNVLLRPIFQDFLFPTAAYIAGPGEAAYFAQLQPVYDHFDIPMPIILPRASITIVEQRVQKVVDKYRLPYLAMFQPEDMVLKSLPEFLSSQNTEITRFKAKKEDIFALAESLPEIVESVDANLRGPAVQTVEKIKHYFEVLEEKVFQARKLQDSVIKTQIAKLHANVYPGEMLQERKLNIVSYLNRYGDDILPRIYDYCAPFPDEHRLLVL